MDQKPTGQIEVPFRGNIFRITQTTQPSCKVFEIAERAPGVRIIIDDKSAGKILLSKEYRHELDAFDFRLPGGKVFDKLEDYEAYPKENLHTAAENQAKVEAREEAGVEILSLSHLGTSTLGATVKWDLYMFVATEWSLLAKSENEDEAEDISVNWVSYDEVKAMILDGRMSEERVALWLLRYIGSGQ